MANRQRSVVGELLVHVDRRCHGLGGDANHPLVGRPVRGGMRELVIGRGSRGYVALHRYMAQIDAVFLLAVRSQRESGYMRGN